MKWQSASTKSRREREEISVCKRGKASEEKKKTKISIEVPKKLLKITIKLEYIKGMVFFCSVSKTEASVFFGDGIINCRLRAVKKKLVGRKKKRMC